jgi:hypothetical protein
MQLRSWPMTGNSWPIDRWKGPRERPARLADFGSQVETDAQITPYKRYRKRKGSTPFHREIRFNLAQNLLGKIYMFALDKPTVRLLVALLKNPLCRDFAAR